MSDPILRYWSKTGLSEDRLMEAVRKAVERASDRFQPIREEQHRAYVIFTKRAGE